MATVEGTLETWTSDYNFELGPGLLVVLSLPWYLLTLLTILANGLALVSFRKEKRLRRYINYYVINLALADFCIGVFVMPVYSVYVMLGVWPFFGRYGCKLFQGVSYALVSVSTFAVLAICADRFYATVAPLSYFNKRSKSAAFKINVFCWILAFVIWIPFNTIWPILNPFAVNSDIYCAPNFGVELKSTLIAMSILFFFPALTMVITNTKVYFTITKSGANVINKSFKEPEDSEHNCGRQTSHISGFELERSYSTSLDCSYDREDDRRSSLNQANVSNCRESVGNGVDLGSNTVPKSENLIINGITETFFDDKCQVVEPATNQVSREDDDKTRENKRGPQKESFMDSKKSFRILSVVVLSYLATWTMFSVVVVYISLCFKYRPQGTTCTSAVTDFIAQYISLTNSFINPLCYAAIQPLFRKTMLQLLLCRWKK